MPNRGGEEHQQPAGGGGGEALWHKAWWNNQGREVKEEKGSSLCKEVSTPDMRIRGPKPPKALAHKAQDGGRGSDQTQFYSGAPRTEEGSKEEKQNWIKTWLESEMVSLWRLQLHYSYSAKTSPKGTQAEEWWSIVNTGVKAALADKPHLEFGNSNFGKNFCKEVKINKKWSLEKEVLHVHALFLQVSCTCQPAY